MKICYVLDIGVYNLGKDSRVLRSTTAAWVRATEGTESLESFEYSGSPGSCCLRQNGRPWECGKDIGLLATRVCDDLAAGHSVALGFEAPMWFSIPEASNAPMQLFGPRFNEERGSEWYLQAGASATVKALSLGTLLFSRLLSTNAVHLTTVPEAAGAQTIVLFEAFVVGTFKQPVPSEVARAANEWDALSAGIAWGGLNASFAVPTGLAAHRLHTAGSNSTLVASVWRMLADTVPAFPKVEGPADCEVVALGRSAPERKAR